MNALTVRLPASSNSAEHRQATAPARRPYRERDFGIGYGSSSGYGTTRRYTSDSGLPRFRAA